MDALDFEALEAAMRRLAGELAWWLLEQRLNADLGDRDGQLAVCRCGRQARYAGRRAKTFETLLGRLRLERAS